MQAQSVILQLFRNQMQQKKTQVCVHEHCNYSSFVEDNIDLDSEDHVHSKHDLLEWSTVVDAARKCTTEALLAQHFRELIDRIEKIKENLDLILSMHIQKFSNSAFKTFLSGAETETLGKINDKEKNLLLKGGQLYQFMSVINKKEVVSEFGVHVDQEQILTLIKGLEDSFAVFKDKNKSIAKQCMLKGWEKWTKGQGIESIQYYSRALELYPEHCESYFQRGFAYHSLGYDVLAQNDYNNCLRICPQHSSSLTNRGYIESQRGNKAKALEWYTKALEANPNDTVSYNNRGYIYFALYRYTDALRDVNRSIELKPSQESYKFRAEIYTKLGRKSEAQRDLEAAKKL